MALEWAGLITAACAVLFAAYHFADIVEWCDDQLDARQRRRFKNWVGARAQTPFAHWSREDQDFYRANRDLLDTRD